VTELSDRWRRVEDLCHAALERLAGERAAFLRTACADDAELLRDVESLLAQESRADRFLETPVGAAAAQVMAAGAPSLSGRRLGVFQVGDLLGSGGMGDVYRARDTRLGRDVALKVLRPEFTSDPDRLARFEREARLLAALNHPHIAAIYGIEQGDGLTGLILELVEGPTLADSIARGRLSLDESVRIARQIAEALEAAHEKGIVHRDLKPANIKIAVDGHVKVLDFGLAKAVVADSIAAPSSAVNDSPTMPSPVTTINARVILGTAAYMAPEQASSKPVDKRADIWAFGCVLYEMLTGRIAFPGDSISETIAAVLDREPDWSALPNNVPTGVRQLLKRCLEKDPKRRLRDIGDAFHELDPQGLPDRTVKGPKPGRRVWIAGAVLAVVIAAAVISAVLDFGSVAAPAGEVLFEIPVSNEVSPLPAVSPDGRHVIYVDVESPGGRRVLWLRPINDANARRLPGTEGAVFPFWSPDSRFIAFGVIGEGLKKIEAAGGPPQPLADFNGVVTRGAWNRDGVILFGTNSTSLQRVAESGGETTQATELDKSLEEIRHSWPWFLPDGRRFLYLAWSDKTENRAVYVGSLDSKTRTRLMPADSQAVYAAPGLILFLQGATLLARPFDADRLEFTGDPLHVADGIQYSTENGRSALDVSDTGILTYRIADPANRPAKQWSWLDLTRVGSEPFGAPTQADTVELSPDTKRVVFAEDLGPRSDLWIYEFDLNRKTQLTTDSSFDHLPIWSADGSYVLFGSARRIADGNSLWEIAANGAAPERLLLEPEPGTTLTALDWSRSRNEIVFLKTQSPPNGTGDIWVLPRHGDQKPRAYLATPFDESQASLSPDGRWLAYTSNESGKAYQVFVRSFPDPTREKRQISSQGGAHPRWKADGTEIYYVDPGSRIVAVPVTAGQSLQTGKPTPLFETQIILQPRPQGYPYDVTADGRFLISAPLARPASPITVVVNWRARLAR
jgi:serine/threonine protein kinase/Tol biopolymer transport system component